TILGGEIHLDSQEGVGSTFTLTLPIRFGEKNSPNHPVISPDNPWLAPSLPEPEKEVVSPPTVLPPKPKKTGIKRLLIVEDDHNFVDILDTYARERGFETLIAYQGDTGLEMAIENLPDAIILDIMLPVMDGWTVLKQLKSNPQTKSIPVHLMSADRPNKRKIEESAVGFLKKPVNKQSLEDVFGLLHKIIDSPVRK